MVIGVSFRTAPVAVRERFWFDGLRRRRSLATLAEADGIEEAIIFSNCERTEFLIWANEAGLGANSVLRHLSSDFDLQLCQWEHFYRLINEDALRHIFCVAGGLDSFIVGNSQVASQMQNAWDIARVCGTSGKCLNGVMEKALAVSERIRSNPVIGLGGPCAASFAAGLANEIQGPAGDHRFVLIGAGRMAETAAACLINQGTKSLRILNRTFEHSLALASKIGGTAVPFEDLQQELAQGDFVISCLSSPEPVLGREQLHRVSKERETRICIIDLGFPHNIDPDVRDLAGVLLYDLDDIQRLQKSRLTERTPAIETAEEIAAAEARAYFQAWPGAHATPIVVALRERLSRVCEQELQDFRQQQGPFPKSQDHLLSELTSRITRRLATFLVHELKETSEKSEQEHMAHAVHRLFHLEEQEKEEKEVV